MTDVDIDSEALIALVKDRPTLWDKTNEIYKDRWATRKAWEDICTLLYKDYSTLDDKDKQVFLKEVILKKWANIRDSYARYCRKERGWKNGTLAQENKLGKKTKKYIYHSQMQFLKKLYDADNAHENYEDKRENDTSRIGIETSTTSVHLNTRSQRAEEHNNSVYPNIKNQNFETLSNTCEDNLTSVETSSSVSQFSDSIFNKRKRSGEYELQNPKVPNREKSDRHLSFFKGIIPSLEEFNEQEVLKFQMGVLQLISNIHDQKQRASYHPIPPHFFSFPSQPGPCLPPSAASYPSNQPVFPTFWSAPCPKCFSESTPRASSSNTVD